MEEFNDIYITRTKADPRRRGKYESGFTPGRWYQLVFNLSLTQRDTKVMMFTPYNMEQCSDRNTPARAWGRSKNGGRRERTREKMQIYPQCLEGAERWFPPVKERRNAVCSQKPSQCGVCKVKEKRSTASLYMYYDCIYINSQPTVHNVIWLLRGALTHASNFCYFLHATFKKRPFVVLPHQFFIYWLSSHKWLGLHLHHDMWYSAVHMF